jgi:hypothetical protein
MTAAYSELRLDLLQKRLKSSSSSSSSEEAPHKEGITRKASGTIKSRYAPQLHHLMTKALINQFTLVVEESQCPRNFQVESPETVRSPTISLLNQ